MDKGHVFILQYIKNLEDQVLADNYVVGKELLINRPTVEIMLDCLFEAKNMHEVSESAYDGYNAIKMSIPEHKFRIDWVGNKHD